MRKAEKIQSRLSRALPACLPASPWSPPNSHYDAASTRSEFCRLAVRLCPVQRRDLAGASCGWFCKSRVRQPRLRSASQAPALGVLRVYEYLLCNHDPSVFLPR